MSEESNPMTKKEIMYHVIPMVLIGIFIVFMFYTIWTENDKMNEYFSSRDITECNKVYDNPDGWKPINGTIQEKYDNCADWYKPGGMNEAAISATSNNKIFMIVLPIVATVGTIIVMFRTFNGDDNEDGKEKETD